MICMFCRDKIDESRGYFTILIKGERYDYHLEHRPVHLPRQETIMKCVACGHEISGGHFVTTICNVEMSFHVHHQPKFFYKEKPDDERQDNRTVGSSGKTECKANSDGRANVV